MTTSLSAKLAVMTEYRASAAPPSVRASLIEQLHLMGGSTNTSGHKAFRYPNADWRILFWRHQLAGDFFEVQRLHNRAASVGVF